MGLMVGITWYYAKKTRDLWKITQTSLTVSWIREILNDEYEIAEKVADNKLHLLEKITDKILNLTVDKADTKKIQPDIISSVVDHMMALQDAHDTAVISSLITLKKYRTDVLNELIKRDLSLPRSFGEKWENMIKDADERISKIKEEHDKKVHDESKKLDEFLKKIKHQLEKFSSR